MRVKDNWMDFIFFIKNGKNCSKSIVQSIGFYNQLGIRNPISENKSRGECLLERIESIMIGRVKILQNVFSDKVCQWNDNVQIVKDEPAIEISKI